MYASVCARVQGCFLRPRVQVHLTGWAACGYCNAVVAYIECVVCCVTVAGGFDKRALGLA